MLRCVTREYSMTSVLLRDDITIPFAIYQFHMAHNARVHYEKLLDLRDVRVHYHIVVYFANIRMTRNYSIYATRVSWTTSTIKMMTNFKIYVFWINYYNSLLERYMKHVFVAGLVTGDFFGNNSRNFTKYFPRISDVFREISGNFLKYISKIPEIFHEYSEISFEIFWKAFRNFPI